jgi:hypothetical protein
MTIKWKDVNANTSTHAGFERYTSQQGQTFFTWDHMLHNPEGPAITKPTTVAVVEEYYLLGKRLSKELWEAQREQWLEASYDNQDA